MLVNEYEKRVEDVGLAIGKSRSYIYKLVNIFSLPTQIIKSLRKGELTVAHCMLLSKLTDNPAVLEDIYKKTVNEALSRRDLETLISGYQQGRLEESDYSFFIPKVLVTEAGSRLRFEPRRRSIRLELNLLNDDFEAALKEVQRELKSLRKRHLKKVG